MRFESINTYLVAVVAIFLITITGSYFFYQQTPSASLIIGAGTPNSESYLFAQSLKTVAENHFPKIEIEIKTTQGSEENMILLENGEIDLGTVQADIIETYLKAGAKSRIVGVLYEDIYQLIVRKDSGIESIFDLVGKRIALPKKGSGQWRSFWFVANHYGVTEKDLESIELYNKVGDQAILSGEIDAAFRVRSARNSEIQDLVETGEVELIPIDQARSLALQQQACKVTTLPKGAYSAKTMIPDQDLMTLAVDRYLLANDESDSKAIWSYCKSIV